MTDEEAKEMRRQLAAHHHDQLFTVREFCDILRQWTRVAGNYLSMMYHDGHRMNRDQEFEPLNIERFFLAAEKSSLLGRMFYGKEKVRTEKCPKHEGVWCGCFIDCPCAGTGWLPNKEEPNDG